jgi:hypothetical protein
MKEVLVTIKVKIDQDVYYDRRDCGDEDFQITNEILQDFNNAKIEAGLVADFEVLSVENIKEVKE